MRFPISQETQPKYFFLKNHRNLMRMEPIKPHKITFQAIAISLQSAQVVIVPSKAYHKANTSTRNRQVIAACLLLGSNVPARETNVLHNLPGKRGLQVVYLLVLDRKALTLHSE